MEQPISKYSNERAPGKEHVPLYPTGFIAVRIIQLVISVVCLGLSAYGLAGIAFDGDALMLFVAIATIITSIYCLVSHFGPPQAYNYWAILGLDIFLVIFWLIAFALLAARVAAGFAIWAEYQDYYDTSDYDTAFTVYGACLAAAAGLGGLEFLLYIISLSIHSIMLHRHRSAGLKAMPSKGAAPAAAGLPAGGEKFQMQPQTVPATEIPPQQGYYQPNSLSPISAQPTGNSYVAPQQVPAPGQPIYEVPGQNQQYHPTQ